jgi:hypothetical protein
MHYHYEEMAAVIEGTSSRLDGQWWALQPGHPHYFEVWRTPGLSSSSYAGEGEEASSIVSSTVRMVRAGRLRWDDEQQLRCAEVFVPDDDEMRSVWRAEHNLPLRSQNPSDYLMIQMVGGFSGMAVPTDMADGLVEDGFVATDRFIFHPSGDMEIYVPRKLIPWWIKNKAGATK